MKKLINFIKENKSNTYKIIAHYYFGNDNDENMYVNDNASKQHKSIADKFVSVIKKYVEKYNLNSEGFESVLEIWVTFDEPIDNIDALIKDLEKVNDKSFVEYITADEYKSN